MRFAFFALYGAALLFSPWWLIVPLGIIVATLPWGIPVAVFGGLVLDAAYGTPIQGLFGISHVYTIIFLIVGLLLTLLTDRVAD